MPETGSSSCFTFADREMPVRFGRYHLLSRIAVDPVGEEFLAAWGVDQGVDQLRTVKCIYPRIAAEAEFVALFSEEARSLSRLSSANVVRVIEVGAEGRVPFVTREHVEGVTLARLVRLADRRASLWPWELAAHVATEILRGLDYVHRREDIHGRPMGMRHGDMRLDNVVISFGGEVKVTGFGSTLRFIVDEQTNARISELRHRFVPPEGLCEIEPTVAADLWGVAMVFLSLLAGKVPTMQLDPATRAWVPPDMSMRVEALPPVVDAFVCRALNPDPDFRFEDAASMRKALLGVMAEHAGGHPPDDLAAWVRDLGREDREAEADLVRRTLGREARLAVEGGGEPPSGALGPGTVLDGRYHLLRRLGEGGMGIVFEAEHLGLGRRLAVKVLHERVLDDENTVERFRREARITGSLGHPNIVGASDFGVTAEGHHYLAMDLLEGESLARRIERGPPSPGELARIMAEVCDGLAAAHAAGVIHRDLKPDNVYLTPTGARILDFGIAKRTGLDSEDQALTRTGHICGTVDYISPEQIRGLSHDPRSDIYAAGVIIYEALTGEAPFHGRTVGETLHKVLNDRLVPPRQRTGDRTIPPELEAICVKALYRKAEKRFQTAAEMAASLRALLPTAGATGSSPRSLRPVMLLAAGGALAAIGIAALVLALGAGRKSAPEAGARSGETAAAPAPSPVIRLEGEGRSEGTEETEGTEGTEDAPARQPGSETGSGAADTSVPVVPSQLPLSDDPRVRAQELAARGEAELKKMRLDAAGELFAEATRLDARNAAAWFGQGRVAFEQGRNQDALGHVGKALRQRPGHPRYRNFRGQIHLHLGDRDRAVAEWRAVLAAHPDNAEARRLLAAAGAQ
jgi:serine/threonine-protein kinase